MSGPSSRNGTLVRSKSSKAFPVSRSYLWNLAKAGKIERIGRGLYRAKEAPISTNETLLEVARKAPLEFRSKSEMETAIQALAVPT